MAEEKPRCARCGSDNVRILDCPLCGQQTLAACSDCRAELCLDEACELVGEKRKFARFNRVVGTVLLLSFVLVVAFQRQLRDWRAFKRKPVIPSIASVPPDATSMPFLGISPSPSVRQSGASPAPTARPVATPSPSPGHRILIASASPSAAAPAPSPKPSPLVVAASPEASPEASPQAPPEATPEAPSPLPSPSARPQASASAMVAALPSPGRPSPAHGASPALNPYVAIHSPAPPAPVEVAHPVATPTPHIAASAAVPSASAAPPAVPPGSPAAPHVATAGVAPSASAVPPVPVPSGAPATPHVAAADAMPGAHAAPRTDPSDSAPHATEAPYPVASDLPFESPEPVQPRAEPARVAELAEEDLRGGTQPSTPWTQRSDADRPARVEAPAPGETRPAGGPAGAVSPGGSDEPAAAGPVAAEEPPLPPETVASPASTSLSNSDFAVPDDHESTVVPVIPSPSPSPAPRSSDPPEVRMRAIMRQVLGVAYSPAGTSLEKGFSPGGLIQWVFRKMGVTNVPRMVEDQMVMSGTAIDPRGYKPRVGDLLFFEINGEKHAGLFYDARRNTFITVVPGKGGVVVADFHDPFFRTRFLFARRIAL